MTVSDVAQLSMGFAVTFDLVDDRHADQFLESEADHWLGALARPFGRQSFGLCLDGELAAVAVSASTPNARCGPYSRYEVVELARCSARDGDRDLTRVVVRLWRKVAARYWSAEYGEAFPRLVAYVSYADSRRHNGDLYRFDGWRIVAQTKGSTGGGTWSKRREDARPKSVWAFELPGPVVHPSTLASMEQRDPDRGGASE